MKIKFIVLILIIIIQLVVVSFLVIKIFNQKKSVLGTTYVNPMNKESIIMNQNEELKYFYEPKANTNIEDKPSWLAYSASYSINSDALNERFEYSIIKQPKTYRIITLGDSFTFGMYVKTVDNYPEKLEIILNKNFKCSNIKKIEVINLGVEGYDLNYTLERFKKRGIKYNPDLIIWLINNHNTEQITEKIIPINISCPGPVGIENSERSINIGVYYKCWKKAIDKVKNDIGLDKIREYEISSLYKFNNYFSKKLLIITFPFPVESNENAGLIKNYVKSRKDTYFNNEIPSLLNPGERLSDSHPTAQGYELMTKSIYKYLTENKIIPCN